MVVTLGYQRITVIVPGLLPDGAEQRATMLPRVVPGKRISTSTRKY
jgi:hypothetical protein